MNYALSNMIRDHILDLYYTKHINVLIEMKR